MRPIYLDHHATTPVDPRVFEAMRPYFTECFGNASSRSHRFGWQAEEAVHKARQQVADLIDATPRQIVFTSGATESNNLAIKGVLDSYGAGRHLITAATEHRSVLDVCKSLERRGSRLTCLPVDPGGRIDPGQLRDHLTPETALVSVMHANNEIGVLQPILEIGRILREHDVLFHCDAVQSAGLLPLSVRRLNIDLLSLSAHKIGGPKGIGALYVNQENPEIEITPQIEGGGQELGLRSGTLNVPAIVGFGEACRIARESRQAEATRLATLRDRLLELLTDSLDGTHVHGSWAHRLPNNLSIGFDGIDGEALLLALGDVAVSRGSACSSARKDPSHVLQAIGVPDSLAQATLRFGLGRTTTSQDIEDAAARTIQAVQTVRNAMGSDLYS